MRNYAAGFARELRPPVCVALHGELGVGKTEFARAAIRAMCGEDIVVPSPTFTLVQEYEIQSPESGGQIPPSGFQTFHFDLYRVNSAEELEEIGFFDVISSGLVFVEWPEIAAGFLPENTMHVYLSVSGAGREVTVDPCMKPSYPVGFSSAQ